MDEAGLSRRDPRRWPVVAAGLLVLAAGLAMAAWSLRLPYYAFSGGPVGDAIDSVEVSGHETYLPEGELLMLTVASQEVNPFEALVAAFDRDVDLVPREALRSPDESDEEFVARNRTNMDLSKETAITLALRRLGYEVVTESDGVLVAGIVGEAPVSEVLQVDDVIIAINGTAVKLPQDISAIVAAFSVGSTIDLEIKRGDANLTVQVELAPRADDPAVPMIGIEAAAFNPRFEYPFPVAIDAGLTGGPSAGMMYTLAVLDLLTPGEMTGGHIVAGTGTIDESGIVGPIGGIRQKVVAAEAAGAEFMLVPASNYEEALTARRMQMELIPVSTLDEALSALERVAAST